MQPSPLQAFLQPILWGSLGLLALFVASISRHEWIGLARDAKSSFQDAVYRVPRLFTVIGAACIGALLIGEVCQLAGNLFDLPGAVEFGGKAKFIGLILFFAFGYVLTQALRAVELDKRRAKARNNLKRKGSVKISLNENSGPIAIAAHGSEIKQIARGISSTVVNRGTLYSFTEDIESDSRPDDDLRTALLRELHALNDQWGRPLPHRDTSRIVSALKTTPVLLSSFGSLAETWEKMEPIIKRHLGV